MVSRDDLEGALAGVQFPLKKNDVIDILRDHPNVKPEMLRIANKLPDISYRRPADVVHGLDFARTKAPYWRTESGAGAVGETR